MNNIYMTMHSFFQSSKTEGSYLLLFALSLVILYIADENKNKWLALYPVVLTLLIVANPLTVWLLSVIFPVVGNYEQITVLLPILVYVPFGIVELLFGLKTHRQRVTVAMVLIFFLSISGNLFGLFGGNTRIPTNLYDEERREVIAFIDDVTDEKSLVLGDDEILPFITSYGNNIPLLYGQDMMMFNSDLGIMDTYDQSVFELHNMMWDPDTNMQDIAVMASGLGCDIIVMNKFDEWPEYAGDYRIAKQTGNYLVYLR